MLRDSPDPVVGYVLVVEWLPRDNRETENERNIYMPARMRTTSTLHNLQSCRRASRVACPAIHGRVQSGPIKHFQIFIGVGPKRKAKKNDDSFLSSARFSYSLSASSMKTRLDDSITASASAIIMAAADAKEKKGRDMIRRKARTARACWPSHHE
ncbi:hypothetical protein OUZ56_022723 [Daphnia magna]|uniref:Uncharacterized protein n=1 Tax=Daphnia magna TaxID=35525 RepID=A0ABR0AX94_9CRUS|nr:hypothetical protein OUZ56_022723 [Daphnia magna]